RRPGAFWSLPRNNGGSRRSLESRGRRQLLITFALAVLQLARSRSTPPAAHHVELEIRDYMLLAWMLALAMTETLTLTLASAAAEVPEVAQVMPAALMSPRAWNVATDLLAKSRAGPFSAMNMLKVSAHSPMFASIAF